MRLGGAVICFIKNLKFQVCGPCSKVETKKKKKKSHAWDVVRKGGLERKQNGATLRALAWPRWLWERRHLEFTKCLSGEAGGENCTVPYCQCRGVPLGDVRGQSELEAAAGPYDEEMEEGRGARHSMAPRSLLQALDFSLRIMGRYCGV